MVSAIANQTVRLEECVEEVKRSGRLPPGRRSSKSQDEDEDEDVDVDVGIECARALKWVVREYLSLYPLPNLSIHSYLTCTTIQT